MNRLSVLMMVSTLVVGTAGCRQRNWFGRPYGAAMMPAASYASPAIPSAPYVSPGATAPSTSPASCGPGCNSCGNTLPILSGPQGYASAPAN
jgi:hypothetical protein